MPPPNPSSFSCTGFPEVHLGFGCGFASVAVLSSWSPPPHRWLGFSITARKKQLTQYLIIYILISIQMLNETQQFQLLYPAVLCSRTQLKCYIICSSYETSPSSKPEVAPQSWHLTGSKLTALCLPMLSEAFSLLGHYGNWLAPSLS